MLEVVMDEGQDQPTQQALQEARRLSLEKFMEARRTDPFARSWMPRRVVPPGSRFMNPAIYCASMWMASCYASPGAVLADETLVKNMLVHDRLRDTQVPIWFMDGEFSRAVMRTKPPTDLCAADVRLPLPAMLWVIDEQFSREMFGWHVPFVSVGRLSAGTPCITVAGGQHRQPVEVERDMLMINFIRCAAHGVWEDYAQARPMDLPLSKCYVGNFDEIDPVLADQLGYVVAKTQDITREQDLALTGKVIEFVFQMLLVMSTRSDSFLTPGECTRKAKVKGNRVMDELWSPHIIGKGYQAARSKAEPGEGGGTVRMHWRRGHLHTVKFGKGRESSRLDWFEPVLVNAPEE